jgi:hypothetical protein
MIEEKLEEAGVELQAGYRLVMLDVPGLELGDLTVDVTLGGRLFRHYQYRNLTCVMGSCYMRDSDPPDKEAVKAALENGEFQAGRVSLAAFNVNIKKSTLKVGRMLPNRQVCVMCLHCGRTYHKDELKISAERHRFFCKACLDKAIAEHKKNPGRRARKPGRWEFRLDRDRNIVRYDAPKVTTRILREIVTAASVPPWQGGQLILPRPFVMFEPGASRVIWMPDSSDPVGQKLQERCARAPRLNGIGQQPVPLNMVIDAYAPKDWDPRPWVYKKPIKVPGIIGVQLLVDGRLAGWVSDAELKRSCSQLGWLRELPEYTVVDPNARAREV